MDLLELGAEKMHYFVISRNKITQRLYIATNIYRHVESCLPFRSIRFIQTITLFINLRIIVVVASHLALTVQRTHII